MKLSLLLLVLVLQVANASEALKELLEKQALKRKLTFQLKVRQLNLKLLNEIEKILPGYEFKKPSMQPSSKLTELLQDLEREKTGIESQLQERKAEFESLDRHIQNKLKRNHRAAETATRLTKKLEENLNRKWNETLIEYNMQLQLEKAELKRAISSIDGNRETFFKALAKINNFISSYLDKAMEAGSLMMGEGDLKSLFRQKLLTADSERLSKATLAMDQAKKKIEIEKAIY